MNSKIKKTCPNCSQPFTLKCATSQNAKDRVPLLLACGHSICEVCIKNMLRFMEPITCKVCLRDMDMTPGNLLQAQTSLYSVFPVNMCLLGEITFQQMQEDHSSGTEDKDCFMDVREILKSIDTTKGHCVECQIPTQKMCKQCVIILCESCFQKTHKFHIFKSHILKNIEVEIEPNFCKTHKDKQLNYYCKDCFKPICIDCLMVGGAKSCKNHDVASTEEMNAGLFEELNEITPKVDETFRRLTKTAVDIGYHLKKMESGLSDTNLNKIKVDVQHHFSKMHAAIQKHEQEIVNIMENLQINEKKSLIKAKSDVASNIKKAKVLLTKINTVLSSQTQNKANLSVLLEEAKEVINMPWFLNKDEEDKSGPLKVTVNEDLCSLIVDYIHLEGNANSAYKLQSTTEIPRDIELPPAPSQPVFPPELVKDVRELYNKPKTEVTAQKTKELKEGFVTNVPKYRSKLGSISSINSVGSNSSYKTFPSAGDSYQSPIVHPVSPFVENNHLQQLHEGSQELIYISHFMGPHNFFVQRACHQDLVIEMLREFHNAISLPKPFEKKITEGKMYLIFNNADKRWQRALVVGVDRRNKEKRVFRVFCVDFGSTETVTVEQLRLCPVAWQNSPPLAMHCSLANVEPLAGSWTSEDSLLIQKIVDNKPVVIHVRRLSSNYNNVTLECDVTTVGDGVSLAHALVFHERAKLIFPKLQYPKVIGLMDRPKLFISQRDLKSKAVEEVYITHIISPDKFYVRKVRLQNTYEELCDQLEREYSLSVTSGTVYCPEVGQVCVINIDKYFAQVSGGGWRRAIVTEVARRQQRVGVFLPDTGEVALVHYSVMRHIEHAFTKIKALATECHLAGVTPLNNNWSAGSVALMEKFQMKTLELHVEEVGRGRSVGVTLVYRPDGDDAACLNTEMIKHKFAVTTGVFKFNTNQVYTNKTPLDKPKTPTNHSEKENLEILNRDVSPEKTIKDQDVEAKDKGPIKLEVKILSCQSPSLVYVALSDQQKTFNELSENIQEYYNKNKLSGKEQWNVGERCCTVCEESKTWRRAVIMELDKDKAKVFYSDFACVESIPVANLKELAPEFASIGNAAIKCHLSGVKPALGKKWPSLTKEYLCELVELYQRIFITKNGAIKDKSIPVELWVYHVIHGDALEPNTAEWRCLNKNIIEQGLGVPDKPQQDANTKEKSESDETISFLNVTGFVREWLQLEPLPSGSQVALPEYPESDSDSVSEDIQEGHDTSPKSLLSSDWLPAEPLTTKEFIGIPTNIDNNGVIYVHLVTQQDTLDLIRKSLDVSFKNPDPEPAKYTKWVVGQPCIARFYLDNKFYRGRVLEVNQETENCIVHFVDYGNVECCTFEEMRRAIIMYQIPIQAQKCVLSRVVPIRGDWDKTTLDFIHEYVVEKRCFIKVCGEKIADVSPIDLKIDKVIFNDLLVDLGMAVYSDGS